MASDIFNVQPPQWLVERANVYKPGMAGQVIGTALGGLHNSLANGESFFSGVDEARASQQDPLWQAKMTIAQNTAQARVLGEIASAESANALAAERKQETRGWLNDAPSVVPWLAATPEKRSEMPTPQVVSQKGATLVERASTSDNVYFNRKRWNDIKAQQAGKMTELQNAIGGMTPEAYAQLNALQDGGWSKDSNGNPVYLSPAGLQILNEDRKKSGLLPFGEKQSTAVKPTNQRWGTELGRAQADLDRAKQEGAAPETVQRFQSQLDAVQENMNLATAQPQTITVQGQTFLQWGKHKWRLDELTPAQTLEVSLAKSQITDLQKMLMQVESGSAEESAIKERIVNEKSRIRKMLSGREAGSNLVPTPVAPAAKPTPANPPTTQPSTPVSNPQTSQSLWDEYNQTFK